MFRELIVDNFAGGGGASTGIELATGRSVDIAINHDPDAIAMHKTNHPDTRHYCESVWDVNPREAVDGHPVALAWLSPDCKHFSKAKGGKPVEKKIRGLAWIAVRWAATVRPRVIMLENVEEFKAWGPIHNKHSDGCTGNHPRKLRKTNGAPLEWIDGKDVGCLSACRLGMPIAEKKGMTFSSFKRQLQSHGYKVEHKELRACDYGAPTIRKRLFLIARCDGQPIVWPKSTHGNPASDDVKSGKLEAWRTAAEIIDFSLDCPSIFTRKRPLAENTLKRIAKGIEKFIVNSADPFIVSYYGPKKEGEFRGQDLDKPLSTQTTANRFALVKPNIAPFITECANASAQRNMAANEPLRTQCAEVKGGHFALVSPFLVPRYSEGSPTRQPRCDQVTKPLNTIVPTNNQGTLVSAFLAKHYTGVVGATLERPCPTVTSVDHSSLVTSHMIKLRNGCTGQALDEPTATITSGGLHLGEVRAFLLKYYGTAVGQTVKEPLHTVTTKERYGLVTIHGEEYQIIDIGMRMLQPHELFAAQGFPDDYIIDHDYTGKKMTKKAQVARCGNAVPPPFAEHLVRANLPEMCAGGAQYEANSKRAVGE
jgi:DNA (cytosine-5)-methyltransferase 1